MLEALFSSRVRIKLLQLFLLSPGKCYHSRELARVVAERQNAIWRELQNLEQVGLLRSATHGNRKEYSVVTNSPLYPELRRLMLKASGVPTERRRETPDIHEKYAMPRAMLSRRPGYIVGETD
jgi:predicted transcriptional regulator